MTDSRTTKFISFKVAKNESGSIFAALKCFKVNIEWIII